MTKPQIQIVGPFATEYSLSRVNRSLAEALKDHQDKYSVSLWANESQVDRLPNSNDLKKYPMLSDLMTEEQNPDVFIFNNFPKSISAQYGLSELNANVKIAYLAWEETIIPSRWIDEMNKNLHGVMVTSEHVRHVFRNSGLKIPIRTVNLGLDQEFPNYEGDYPIKSTKKFKFLHISSAHYRKGIDLLIKAYFESFTNEDDVVLVLKLFPNPNAKVDELIAKYKSDSSPEIEIINDPDLTDGEIVSLYKQCDAVVLPSRAEGFGIPMAEAMMMERPLITTGYSGQADFCKEDNCFLLDYSMINSDSQLGTPGAKVAEPDIVGLKTHMQYLYKNIGSELVKEKVANAKAEVSKLTWKKNAEETITFIDEVKKYYKLKNKKLAVLGPRNSTGGIEEYIKDFYSNIENSFKDVLYLANVDAGGRVFEDEDNIVRTWEIGEKGFGETNQKLLEFEPDILHIQYHPAYFSLPDMGNLIKSLVEKEVDVYLTPHAVQVDYINWNANKDILNLCKAIYVHAELDMEFLEEEGLKNIELFKFGIQEFSNQDKDNLRKRIGLKNDPVIAIHGLIHNQKGMVEVIEAIKLLKQDYPDILLISATALNTENSTSSATFELMQKAVKSNNLEDSVIFITDFIDTIEVVRLLQLADLVVFAYPELKEGASGAIRKSFAALRPVVITKSHIFRDLDVGFVIENNEPKLIAGAVKELLVNKELYNQQVKAITNKVMQESWGKMSEIYLLDLCK